MADTKVPELFVEQVLLDEVSPERRAELARAAGAEGLARRLAELRRSDAEILERYPAAELAARIGARLDQPERGAHRPSGARVLRFPGVLVPLAAAAALILVATFVFRLVGSGLVPFPSASESVRVKGLPRLMIYRQGRDGAELLQDRAPVREGDVLQIRYVPAGRSYGAIVSVDGRGTVTLHFPEASDGSTRLEGDKAAALAYAYQLDDAPGFERFFFVTAPRSFPASVVIASAERLSRSGAREGALSLPRGFEQVSELFVKEE